MAKLDIPSLIRAMLRPEFYPHPVTGSVRVLETHISYVLLTGEHAYKVKKPVDLGFLDFSTLDRRRHFCFEELRRNARGAPGLYLDVVPITQEGGDFSLGGGGEPVEYAVKMRQFPQESLCRAMLETGVLADRHVLALAATVARYHSGAATGDRIAVAFDVSRLSTSACTDTSSAEVGSSSSSALGSRIRARAIATRWR